MAYNITITELNTVVNVDPVTGQPVVVNNATTSFPLVIETQATVVKGEKGDRGDPGDTGPAGPQGVSVVDASVETGNLILTLSNSSIIDAGTIQSAGTSVDWSNVHITGGSINNTIIGNATPTTATFTTMVATTIDSATMNGGYF